MILRPHPSHLLRPAILCVLLLVSVTAVRAQYEQVSIDTVVAFAPGTKQNSGQAPTVFPKNIFGLRDARADTAVPVTDARSVCSIGYGGVITVGFTKHVVVDGPGADFTIFENAFRYAGTRIYAEPAFVEVSSDGIDYKLFPYDTMTLSGCAGVTPVYGDADPFDPLHSGGDAFDLATIGVDSVRFVRITDVTSVILNNPQHAFFDPTLTGFDLDALSARHAVRAPMHSALTPIPGTTSVLLDLNERSGVLRTYSVAGMLIDERHVVGGSYEIELDHLPPGPLILTLTYGTAHIVRKVLR